MLRIFRHYFSTAALCLFVCEAAMVGFVLYAASVSLQMPGPGVVESAPSALETVIIPALIVSIGMYALGLYKPQQLENLRRTLPRLVAVLCIFAPILVVTSDITWINPELDARGRALVYLRWTIVLFSCVLLARLGYWAVIRMAVRPHRAVVVGVGRLAAELEELTAQRSGSGTEIVGYVPLSQEAARIPAGRIRSSSGSLLALARDAAASEIVVALDDRRGVPLTPLLEARAEGIRITNYLSFWERETRRVNLEALDPSWLIYSDGYRLGTTVNAILKRALDVGVSLALLILALPTILLTALAIKLDSRGPILYRQERVGRDGATFDIYKFRTMQADAEKSGVPQWAAVRDPRVTAIGSVLRMTRIDELPQLLNVLRGEMSFVGPRPERPFFVENLSREIPFYSERHRVRPGITGWAQINYPYGASIKDARAKLSYDLYYIKNYSFLFDLLIILSTAHAVLVNKGGR